MSAFPNDRVYAAKILSMIDLTRLEPNDDPKNIIDLCERANTPFGPVAAVCVYPEFVKLARKTITNKRIHVASVANFPKGRDSMNKIRETIEQCLRDGADEMDVVFPYHRPPTTRTFFPEKIRDLCPRINVKMILETGAWSDRKSLALVCDECLDVGIDYLKTSTGKIPQGARIEDLKLFINRITQTISRPTGIKISGGIRTLEQAKEYIDVFVDGLGLELCDSGYLRFGASQLLDDVLRVLNEPE